MNSDAQSRSPSGPLGTGSAGCVLLESRAVRVLKSGDRLACAPLAGAPGPADLDRRDAEGGQGLAKQWELRCTIPFAAALTWLRDERDVGEQEEVEVGAARRAASRSIQAGQEPL